MALFRCGGGSELGFPKKGYAFLTGGRQTSLKYVQYTSGTAVSTEGRCTAGAIHLNTGNATVTIACANAAWQWLTTYDKEGNLISTVSESNTASKTYTVTDAEYVTFGTSLTDSINVNITVTDA